MDLKRNLMLMLSTQLYEWRSIAAYRAQLLVNALFSAVNIIVVVVFIAVIYQVSAGFSGWTFYQLLLLASTAGMAGGLLTYVIDISYISDLLMNGDLDTVITKPFDPAFHLFAIGGNRYAIFTVLSSLVVFIYAALNSHFAPAGIAVFLLLFVFGLAAMMMFCLFLTALSYAAFTSSRFVENVVTYMFGAGSYPLSIYGLVGTVILTIALPIGLAIYFPAEAFFGKIDPTVGVVVFAVELAFIGISYLGFGRLLRRYTSALG